MAFDTRLNLGQFIMILGMAGTVAAGLWEGGRINQTLLDGVATEAAVRMQDVHAIDLEINGLNRSMDSLQADVREIRVLLLAERQAKGSKSP